MNIFMNNDLQINVIMKYYSPMRSKGEMTYVLLVIISGLRMEK